MLNLILVFWGLTAVAGETTSMWQALFNGPPEMASKALDPSAYVTEKVQKLKNPQIAYVNWNALEEIFRQMGYKNPPTELTPQLAEDILNLIGYAKRVEGESLDAFVDDFREVYSIRYGGRWINYNFGAGRNGAAGKVDIKGIGRTSLVRPWANGSHSSGIAGLPEAIKEAVWSNILHEELPYGANRVLFILTTGTQTVAGDPNSDARALIVREDSNRPAYYQANSGVTSTAMSDELREMHTAADLLRMQKVLPRLIENLPQPANLQGAFTKKQVIRMGFLELIDRAMHQYATAYTRQIILAGISTSNIEIDGRAIDYGVTSALIGFPQARFSDSESPHGTTDSLKSDLFFELAEDYRDALPENLKSAIPSHAEIAERIDTRFHLRLLQGFLELAGTPPAFSEDLVQSEQGRAFGEILLQLARAGNQKIHPWANGRLVGRTGTYNFERVMNELVRLQVSADADQTGFAKALDSKQRREELLTKASAYQVLLEQKAKQQGLPISKLHESMPKAVKALNRSFYALRDRPALWSQIRKVSLKMTSGEDSSAVQNWIDETVDQNTHRPRQVRAGLCRQLF